MTYLGKKEVKLQATNGFSPDITKHLDEQVGYAKKELQKQYGENIDFKTKQTGTKTTTKLSRGYGGCSLQTTVSLEYEIKAYKR